MAFIQVPLMKLKSYVHKSVLKSHSHLLNYTKFVLISELLKIESAGCIHCACTGSVLQYENAISGKLQRSKKEHIESV